jgi:hypothetical protein
VEVVDSLSIVEADMTAAAAILARGEGLSWAYDLLAHVAARHGLSDAWLVVDPVAGPGAIPGVGPQLFALGGKAVSLETARTLLLRPAGVYGEPPSLDTATSTALGAMCGAAFRASLASLHAAIDPASGLHSGYVITEAVARAAACAARYGWSSTLVLLTTSGDAPAEDRWRGLAAALREALRSGDEAGVTAPGTALALLGNAGPDAVRPFVARVRAALSAGGWEEIDLHAAAARTPEQTVDPAELMRLAAERLAGAAGTSGQSPGPTSAPPNLELELRLLPGVVCVELATPVVVLARQPDESLHDEVLRTVLRRRSHGTVRVLTVPDGLTVPPYSAHPSPPAEVASRHGNGNGYARRGPELHETGGPVAISAFAPGASPATSRAAGEARVLFLGASFDAARGTSEVSLALGAARGTGRASAGPLAGGAQATLNALEALAIDVPFYLVSAERAHGVPGDPVVVVLAPKQTGEAGTRRTVERLGVASGEGDVEAAGRATLGALNRHLSRTTASS